MSINVSQVRMAEWPIALYVQVIVCRHGFEDIPFFFLGY